MNKLRKINKKKKDHPNIVKLFEVIDDPNYDKLYLVTDLMKKGAILSKTYFKEEKKIKIKQNDKDEEEEEEEVKFNSKGLSINKVRKYFRDLLLGIEYCNKIKLINFIIKKKFRLIKKII